MTRPRTHQYQPDWRLPPARPGGPRLCLCGLPRDNQRHDLPDQTETSAAEARRYGERT